MSCETLYLSTVFYLYREHLQQNSVHIESLKSQLQAAESNHKASEALATERAHQIATLERECKVRDERLSGLQEAGGSKEGRMRELEEKLATTMEKLTQTQVERERLIQQVGPTTRASAACFI